MDKIEKVLFKAKMLISEGNYGRALNILNKSLKEFIDNPGILTQLSIVYELMEDFVKSEDMLEKAFESDPNYARAHYIKGIDYQNNGDLKKAENEFLLAIDNYPNYQDSFRNEHISEAHCNLGTVYYLMKKHDEAVNHWRLAITYDRNNIEASNNLRDFSDKPIKEAISGKNIEDFIDRGVELSEEDRLVESIQVLKKALDLDKNHPLANYNMGLVYGKKGDFDKALEHFETFLENAPEHPEASKIKDLIMKIKNGDFG